MRVTYGAPIGRLARFVCNDCDRDWKQYTHEEKDVPCIRCGSENIEERSLNPEDIGTPEDGLRRGDYEPILDVADRWDLPHEHAEAFLESVGYYDCETATTEADR